MPSAMVAMHRAGPAVDTSVPSRHLSEEGGYVAVVAGGITVHFAALFHLLFVLLLRRRRLGALAVCAWAVCAGLVHLPQWQWRQAQHGMTPAPGVGCSRAAAVVAAAVVVVVMTGGASASSAAILAIFMGRVGASKSQLWWWRRFLLLRRRLKKLSIFFFVLVHVNFFLFYFLGFF